MFNGKTHYKWPCSIAMLVYQRVPSSPVGFHLKQPPMKSDHPILKSWNRFSDYCSNLFGGYRKWKLSLQVPGSEVILLLAAIGSTQTRTIPSKPSDETPMKPGSPIEYHTYIPICVYMHVYMCMYLYIYTYIHTYTCIYIYSQAQPPTSIGLARDRPESETRHISFGRNL